MWCRSSDIILEQSGTNAGAGGKGEMKPDSYDDAVEALQATEEERIALNTALRRMATALEAALADPMVRRVREKMER